ncbi:MAG: c-type cytochrome biogenesis protein CcsB [Oscillospiraceae bacterium]|nr:c-type cytochrome biogenesis protein CcsB [Oscillospiraceae bacterium]
MDILFFSVLVLYLVAVVLQFIGAIFKKEKLLKAAWLVFLAGFIGNSAYMVVRGIAAHRLPLSNQFEFATAFAWGIALLLIFLKMKKSSDWLATIAMPAAFLVLSYAALQPKEITELMPALRSAWFGLHIGSAVFSYSAFVLAGCTGLRRILTARRNEEKGELKIQQMDFLSYRLVGFGFLLLTVVILSGAIWAEQAWSAFWTWDPKEVWALITWIIYAVYLHLRLRGKRDGNFLAWFVVLAVPVVLFTFAGVNTLMSGLHSYG